MEETAFFSSNFHLTENMGLFHFSPLFSRRGTNAEKMLLNTHSLTSQVAKTQVKGWRMFAWKSNSLERQSRPKRRRELKVVQFHRREQFKKF